MDDFVGRKHLIPQQRLRELTERSDLAGAVQCASHFGAIAATGYGLWASWGTLLALPLFVLHGMLLNYLFAAQHECNHYTAFKTRWVNDVVNRITGFVVLYPRSYERWYHFEHHRHTQDWSRDPELMGRKPYRLRDYLLYLFGLSYWISLLRRLMMNAAGCDPGAYFTHDQRRHVRLEARWHLVGYATVALASVAAESALALQLWLAPMLSTKILHQVQNITEHTGVSHEPDTVHNTRTIRTWAVLRWMAWNMQYHTAHHTYPAVPFHRLPELHRELVARLGYEPPHTGYLAFQRHFLKSLLHGPEPAAGRAESPAPEATTP